MMNSLQMWISGRSSRLLGAWRIWFSLFIIVLVCAQSGFAGRGDKAGTAGGSELLIPVGARGLALSGSSLATTDGIEATYWNPSGLAFSSDDHDVMFSHMGYLDGIGVDYAALGLNMGEIGEIAASVKSLSFGDIPVTTADAPDGTGQVISPEFLTGGFTYARKVTDHICVGMTLQYLYESFGGAAASGFAFTGGLQYHGLGGLDALSVGVVVRNIGPSLSFTGDALTQQAVIVDSNRPASQVSLQTSSDPLPSTIEVGLGYDIPVNTDMKMTVTSSFQNNDYSDDIYNVGVEGVFRDFLSLRAGYSFSAADTSGTELFGFSGGFGCSTTLEGAKVQLDYTYRTTQYFNGNHVVSLEIGF
jgi:hypothetical protein